MFKNLFAKYEHCKTCFKQLYSENKRIGLCDNCAEKEKLKLKKRMIISSIFGIILVVIIALIPYYIYKANAVEGEATAYTYYGLFAYERNAIRAAFNNLSPSGFIKLGLIVFLLPFASYVSIDLTSSRHQATLDLHSTNQYYHYGRGGAGGSSQGMEKAVSVLISIIISAVSGPFFFVYRLFKYRQISDHLKA